MRTRDAGTWDLGPAHECYYKLRTDLWIRAQTPKDRFKYSRDSPLNMSKGLEIVP